MKKILFIFLPLFCLVLVGCNININDITKNNIIKSVATKMSIDFENSEVDETNDTEISIENTQIPYTLTFDVTYDLSELENENNIIYGINTRFDDEMRIKDFEEKSSVDANHYVYEYILGTEFDEKFILDCISSGKSAFIRVIPSKYNMYNTQLIYDLCDTLSFYNIQYYIELFPNPSDNISPIKYIAYFNDASYILKNNIEDLAIIFTPNYENLLLSNDYYPDIASYDFVGFEYIGYIENKDDEIYNDFFNKLDYVYYQNYFKKPIFITTFALSYYSNKYSTYYVYQNIEFINNIFSKINENYYRVKGINFYSIEDSQDFFKNEKYNNDNYSIIENDKIKANFNKLVSSSDFSNKYIENDGVFSKQYIYDAILVDDNYYVNAKILENKYIIKLNYGNSLNSYIFNKKNYINIHNLLEIDGKLSLYVDDSKKHIYIN